MPGGHSHTQCTVAPTLARAPQAAVWDDSWAGRAAPTRVYFISAHLTCIEYYLQYYSS
jgi:hypothetical protein